jgi:hypothetical protein
MKSDKKPWWQQVEDGDVPDYSRDHAGIYRERLAEESGEAPVAPPAVLAPSQFSTLPEGDPNNTVDKYPHVDVIRELQRRSTATPVEQLTEEELDAEIKASAHETLLGYTPPATAVPPHSIHSDGVTAASFVGEVPGTGGVVFSNPGRSESRKVHVPAAHEIVKK